MTYLTFSSRQYPDVTVRYTYSHEPELLSYSGDSFNGGSPAWLEIEISDVHLCGQSIYDLISLSVLDGLEDEIREHIYQLI